MSDFGDTEPEDAWHPDDPLPLLIHNLFQRLALLEHMAPRDLHESVRELERRIKRMNRKRNQLTARELLRLDQLAEDTQLVMQRL